ncbi:MAG: NAD(P)H-dependent oxidoreductase [Bacteroidia bacterium]|nr:NAD(P)H-dependent oxidoreductase [Bacteroidia bacterium]
MIAILTGSSRTHSKSSSVSKAIKRICMAHGVDSNDIFLPDFTQYDIPFHNGGDLHKDHLSPFQKSVYEAMSKAQIIFIVSPEYNWFPSAEIINLINQFGSREFQDCWEKKLFATCGVSSGRGGRIPSVQLSYVVNKLINVMDLHSMVSAKMFESQFTSQVLDAEGNSLGNAEYDKGIEKFVAYNLEMAKKVNW